MEMIFKTVFGSHLYGTANENSDIDIKQIHKHSLEEIILRKNQNNIQKMDDEEDFESKELRVFIYDCLYGQTYAQDVLWASSNFWKESSKIWENIQYHKNKLVTNKMYPFVAYCRGQAFKFSKKGDKLNELISLKDILEKFPSKNFLKSVFEYHNFETYEHIKIVEKMNSGSKRMEIMLQVVDSFYPENRQISEILKSVSGKIDAFGNRSKKASQNKGMDLKAFYHAFRVAWEYEELLTTGKLEFPSKNVQEMIKMRNGFYEKEYLEKWIVDEISRIETLENNLPEPDFEFWDAWILDTYLKGK